MDLSEFLLAWRTTPLPDREVIDALVHPGHAVEGPACPGCTSASMTSRSGRGVVRQARRNSLRSIGALDSGFGAPYYSSLALLRIEFPRFHFQRAHSPTLGSRPP